MNMEQWWNDDCKGKTDDLVEKPASNTTSPTKHQT
jgi:hypothetical protein